MSDFEFGDKSKQFLKNPLKKYNILYGSVRSSKTVTACFKWLKELFYMENSYLHLVGGVTSTTSYENNINTLIWIMDYYGIKYEYKHSEWKLIIYGRNGAKQTVLVRGFNNSETSAKIKGLTLQSALLDELCELDYNGVKMLETRLTDKDAFLIATTNPPVKGSWLDEEYLTNPDKLNNPNYYFQHFQLKDNITLSDEYLEHLNSLHKPGSFFHEMYILGKISRAEGVILTGFNETKHVADIKQNFINTKNNQKKLYVGIDYNAAIQHSSVLVYHDNIKSYVIDECVVKSDGNNLTDELFVDKMLIKYNKYLSPLLHKDLIFICPHDAKSLKNTIISKGYNAMTYKPDVMKCIEEINSQFNMNQIVVDESCKEYIKSLINMVWDKKKADKGETAPNKENGMDHMFEASRGPLMKKGTLKGYIEEKEEEETYKSPVWKTKQNPTWLK